MMLPMIGMDTARLATALFFAPSLTRKDWRRSERFACAIAQMTRSQISSMQISCFEAILFSCG